VIVPLTRHYQCNKLKTVCTAMGNELDGRGSIPGKGKSFLFYTKQKSTLEPTQPLSHWVPRAFPLGVKRQGRKADYSPPSSAEIKSVGFIPPLPRLHGVVLK
jgi:hypothetical protein